MLNLRRWLATYRKRQGHRVTLDKRPPLAMFMNRVRVATLILVVYWLVLFGLTHVPGGVHSGIRLIPVDKIAHLTGYTLLAFLLAWSVTAGRRLTWLGGCALWAIVATYGVVDELTQAFIPRRSPDVQDWLADALGAALGLAIFAVVARVAAGDASQQQG